MAILMVHENFLSTLTTFHGIFMVHEIWFPVNFMEEMITTATHENQINSPLTQNNLTLLFQSFWYYYNLFHHNFRKYYMQKKKKKKNNNNKKV